MSSRRALAVDAALAVALAAWAFVATWDATEEHPALRASLAAATLLSLVVRRQWPSVSTLWFAAGMAAESLATEAPDEEAVILGCVIAAYSVAAHAVRREAVLGASLLTLALAVAIVTDPSDSAANVLPTALLFIGVPFAVGLTVRRRQEQVARLTLETARLAEEADAAVEAERRRIARELHDVVSHAVTLIAVRAEAGAAVLDTDRDEARRSLDAIGQVSREALAELHRLLGLLGEDSAGEAGLERVPALVAGVRDAGLDVSVVGDPPTGLAPEVDHCAYRVVQEGLTNALRHAPDSRVRVRVEHDATTLRVAVDSTGTRHTSAYGGAGRGIDGLRDRVRALGGTLVAESTTPGGHLLDATIPLGAS